MSSSSFSKIACWSCLDCAEVKGHSHFLINCLSSPHAVAGSLVPSRSIGSPSSSLYVKSSMRRLLPDTRNSPSSRSAIGVHKKSMHTRKAYGTDLSHTGPPMGRAGGGPAGAPGPPSSPRCETCWKDAATGDPISDLSNRGTALLVDSRRLALPFLTLAPPFFEGLPAETVMDRGAATSLARRVPRLDRRRPMMRLSASPHWPT
mmetsp:Transcript_32735/g.98906  ORF Transcript_32735/g.98906 Transcript_32735/m.98906 type:complete len:204 (-) Transcript_32735:1130-1741(-)